MNGPITLSALRCAAAVAEHGSFSAAARSLGVSQPTISNAVAGLEEALGARLFERSTRRLAPTPSGARLLPLVSGALAAVADLTAEARALKAPARKLVRIGFSSLVGAQRVAQLFGPFAVRHAGVELIYKECTRMDLESRLDGGALDFACGIHIGDDRRRARRELFREPLRFIAPGAPAEPPERATLRDAAAHQLVLTAGLCGLAPATRDLFERARLPLRAYPGEALGYGALEEWAELGIGGAVLPASHIRRAPSAALVDRRGPIELVYEAVWRRDLVVADHVRELVRYLRAVVPALARGFSAAGSRAGR
jgi:LysR family hydrogen peroxide-inducible transcriptional activator